MTFDAFKGAHSYEIQVGKIVLQIRHRAGKRPPWYNVAPIRFWIDPLGRWF